MLLDTLRAHRAEINLLAQKYGARRIRVFGSVARREEGPDSDVDFLVDLPQGYDLFRQRMPLARELSDMFGREVDLIPEHELNRHIRPYVLDEAVEL
ncbi:nucleotidyltransferase family protein [Thauera sp. 2A1]|uniref:nucleotidyltransferase family protein n=1 Tax=Thauera sp. 2A1 TaxID=2570191 RepID=UPI00129242AF|nr:nucleotidyltransferase family protein [Thauera sp. 2A1]KAI5916024.1 nucleotidyltransferase family protein [Thauera sp. 2A1]